MPLCMLWQTGTQSEIAFAVIHCTLGEILITTACLGGAVSLLGLHGWPGIAIDREERSAPRLCRPNRL